MSAHLTDGGEKLPSDPQHLDNSTKNLVLRVAVTQCGGGSRSLQRITVHVTLGDMATRTDTPIINIERSDTRLSCARAHPPAPVRL